MASNGVKQANGIPSSNAAKYNLPSHFIGGNHLGVAPQSKVKDFVAAHGGHTVITKVRLEQFRWKAHRLGRTDGRLGADCQQWYRSGQGDPLGAEMGIRDFWR